MATKVEELDLSQFRKDAQEALKTVEEKYGLKIELGKIRYRAVDFSMNFKAVLDNGDVDGKRVLFEQSCERYGFEPSDYMREFEFRGVTYRLTEFNPKRPKNNCTVEIVETGEQKMCNNKFVLGCFQ